MKAAANTELYKLEKHPIQIDIDTGIHENSSEHTDDNASPRAEDSYNPNKVRHVQQDIVSKQYHVEHDENISQTMRKKYTVQHMFRTMKTAKNFCCCKLQICLEKIILNDSITHNLKVCVTTNI